MSAPVPVLVGIGSNIAPEIHIPAAIRQLRERFGAVRVSTFYRTRPLRGRIQPDYVNGAATFLTASSPVEVRRCLAEIEAQEARVRAATDAYAPRTLDLDLMLYGDLVDTALELPAAELLERDFVLIPAAELMPDHVHPLEGRRLADLARIRFSSTPNIVGAVALDTDCDHGVPRRGGARRCRAPFLGVLVACGVLAGLGGASLAAAAPVIPDASAAGLIALAGVPRANGALRRVGHLLRRLLVMAALVYVGLIAVMAVNQGRHVYFPTREMHVTPAAVGLTYEEVWLELPRGERVHGWFVPAADSGRGTVLFCHGNGGNISHRLDTLAILHGLGFGTFIFDYRGYGRSSGRPSEANTYADAAAAWDYLVQTRGVPPAQVLVFGRSLGGAVAAWVAANRRPGAVVIESTFSSIPDIAADLYPFLPVRLLSRFRYPTVAQVRQAACPVVVIHSPDDEIIPYRHGQAIHAAAAEPKAFIEIRGGHNDGFLLSRADYTRELDAVLQRWFPRPAEGNARPPRG